jgi:aspartate/methionine/tyrosine aminotransferase
VKKRAIVAELAALRTALDAITASQGEIDLPALHTAVAWLHERVDTVATKLGNMRGDPALDGAAVKRLAFAVAQFSARLDRLEAPPPPKPKRKPRTAK